MTVAIISLKTRKAQRDEDGNLHIYESADGPAVGICARMNKRAAEVNGVDPLNGIPEVFRVVPW